MKGLPWGGVEGTQYHFNGLILDCLEFLDQPYLSLPIQDTNFDMTVVCDNKCKDHYCVLWMGRWIDSIDIWLDVGCLVMPSGEAGQWGLRPSHCGRWHWTVMAYLSSVQFRVVLGWSLGLLDRLSYVPIRGLPLKQCPVAMTLIPLLVINGNFYLQYGLGLVLVVVLYRLGLPSGFLSWYYIVWDCLLLSVLSTIL